ncbi:MAG TPA: glycerate kinase [Candidatus Limnocylindria bacterium]|nr:glycerate kinase [Candidatus Limnocylindria bacterium]
MRVLVAPDSYKGSLDTTAVARALAEGWRRGRPADEVRLIPLADGGEGTLEAVRATGGDWLELPVHARDPLGRPLRATFLRRGDQALIELAAASGLSRLAAGERDALAASTFGTGQVLAAAIGLGVRDIVIGLGGSATTDGGAGLLTALGARLLDERGEDLPAGGGALVRLDRLDLGDLAEVLGEVRLTVASDVSNPLLGERGAAATYGPQKGADERQVGQLEAALAHYADVVEAEVGRHLRAVPGAGAAGGTTFGLLAIAARFASFEIRAGVSVVMQLTGFEAALAEADLVLTGEGRVDAQTAYGKTAMGVARAARGAGVAAVCFGGGATPDGIATLAEAGVIVVPVTEQPMSTEQAIAAGPAPLVRAAERAARLVSLGERPRG